MSTSFLPLKFKYLQIKQRTKVVLTKKSRFLSFVYLSLSLSLSPSIHWHCWLLTRSAKWGVFPQWRQTLPPSLRISSYQTSQRSTQFAKQYWRQNMLIHTSSLKLTFSLLWGKSIAWGQFNISKRLDF